MPHPEITELLLEVDQWVEFTHHFTHLRSDDFARDRSLLLTVILADAINLGLVKMSEACLGTTFYKLDTLRAWHVREETYSKALAEIINYQHKLAPSAIGELGRPPHPTDNIFASAGAASIPARSTLVTAAALGLLSIRISRTDTRRSI